MTISRVARPLIYVAVVVAGVVPVAMALALSYHQALREQEQRADIIASEVLRRAQAISEQIARARAVLQRGAADSPCSPANIELMRKAAIGASYLQAVGYIRGDRLLCWSYGNLGKGIQVGPPDYLSSRGAWIRKAVEIPEGTDERFFIVTEADSGYSSLALPDLVLDVGRNYPDVAIGLVAVSNGTLIFGRGQIDVHRLPRLARGQQEFTWVDSQNVGTFKGSATHDYAGIALISSRTLQSAWLDNALWMVPVGAIVGCAFGLLTLMLFRQHAGMPAQLARAMRGNELFLVYMPIVDLANGRWVGAEALLRWRRQNGDVIGPDTFIPVAEQYRLIGRLTEKVLEIVVADAHKTQLQNAGIYISINLSAADFTDPTIVGKLLRTKQESQMNSLMVEVTERDFLNVEQAQHTIERLRGLGIRIAIDDFGTGYSSLSHLGALDVDYLKIDKSFVSTIGTDAVTSHVIKHIIEIAKGLGFAMIAEGVETQAQVDYLRASGVQYAQGWLFGKPIPADQFASALQDAQRVPLRELHLGCSSAKEDNQLLATNTLPSCARPSGVDSEAAVVR
ncbi:EAL domain-containing protein [Paraburkholderia sp. CNPSo 3274]|uniref:EAL domain-containing protein n=1 Tax=Paraburkholderia sp. CNPSo 3274 TaxID=2940932 RepID=UPI0020B63B10|nr:EAL domain-containing protein [Paraburkholderia sp. CNPSo 3274]MCP3713294.1 EAL domain-containing protein [Paraburkholderia sp. CNPSo 3274]